MPPPLNSSLGLPVSTREFSFYEMVARAWGSEFNAPDHRIYQFGGVRFFDSTDMGYTGLYSPGISQATAPVLTVTGNVSNITAVDLKWTLSAVYGSLIDYYDIFRSVNGGASTLLVSLGYEKDFTTYTDSSLNPSNVYAYYVVAIPDVGTSSSSNIITVAQATPPVLAGTLVGTTEVDLVWTPSTVPNSTIQNYFLYRQVDGGGFTLLTVTAGNVLAFNDLTVSAGHTYDYYVVAQPVSGFDSQHSNTVTEIISGASIDALIDIAFIDATHVVGVTATGNAAWSGDTGVTTHPVVAPLANINQFNMVQSGNGVAVALGVDPSLGNRLLRTTDGQTWTDTTPGTATSIFGIYFSLLLNEFISWDGGSTRIYTSPDGVTWTSHVGNHGLNTLANTNFVETGGVLYVGTEAVSVNQVWSSTDGITYTSRLNTSVNNLGNQGPVLSAGVFCAATITSIFGTNDVYTSPNGVTWTKKSSGASITTVPPYLNLQAFGGLFVTGAQTGGDGKTIATSPDGVTWTNRTPTVAITAAGPAIRGTTSALYVFGSGCAHTSDFSSWTLDVTNTNTVNQIKEGSGSVVAGGADGLGVGKFFKLV